MNKRIDLTGQKFNRLTVIDEAESRIRPNGAKIRYWKCRCDCGAIKEVDTQSLKNGSTKSCGCWRNEKSRKDLTGQRFGRLVVVRFEGIGHRTTGQAYCNWLCKCDCGNEIITQTSYLTCGETKSCGCLQSDVTKHHYEGMKFGNLTVIKEDGRDKNGCVVWLCRCDCGNEYRTTSTYLRRGFSTSCGCLTNQKMSESSKTHGMSNTRIYQVWKNMKDRCYNKNNREFHNYGGRGITVCGEWENNFEAFNEWAKNSGYIQDSKFGECTLDRINVNGNYEPNNCRWITNKEQQNNKRDNVYITYKNQEKTLTEWANIYNINVSTLRGRLKSGWSINDALELPIMTKYRSVKEEIKR